MSNIHLEEISLSELKSLHKQVTKAIESFEERQKKQALAELEAKANEFGFSLSELTGATVAKKKRKSAPPKYRHPDDASITWTGRGRHPDWFKEAVRAGISPEDLLA
ncbi:H-NS histone family protein [Seohaeicola saemankumensis]|uniref:H-NS histone family protein n=1 Tax=Seohaeicola saemankumensis TaxID=481181 RepID=UPI0035D128C2